MTFTGVRDSRAENAGVRVQRVGDVRSRVHVELVLTGCPGLLGGGVEAAVCGGRRAGRIERRLYVVVILERVGRLGSGVVADLGDRGELRLTERAGRIREVIANGEAGRGMGCVDFRERVGRHGVVAAALPLTEWRLVVHVHLREPVGCEVEVAAEGGDGRIEAGAVGGVQLRIEQELHVVRRVFGLLGCFGPVGVFDTAQVGVTGAHRAAVAHARSRADRQQQPPRAAIHVVKRLIVVLDHVDADVALRGKKPTHLVALVIRHDCRPIDAIARTVRRVQVACVLTVESSRTSGIGKAAVPLDVAHLVPHAPVVIGRVLHRCCRRSPVDAGDLLILRFDLTGEVLTIGLDAGGRVIEAVGDERIAVQRVALALVCRVDAGRSPSGIDTDITNRQVPAESGPAVAACRVIGQWQRRCDAPPLRNVQRIGEMRTPVVGGDRW